MIKILINDEEVVCNKEFTISEEMLNTSSVTLNNCYPKSWETTRDYISNFYYPLDYSKCKIYDDDILIFAGVVKNTGNISLNPHEPHFCSIQILDFKTFLSEGETLDFVISNKTIKEAIEMVIEAIQDYGVVVGNINILNGDDVIGAYSTENKTAYDVLQYLADISQSKWSTRMTSENIFAIDFYDPALMPVGTPIEYTTLYFETNNIVDMSYSYGTRDYRNKQVILSDEVYGGIDYEEQITATGYTRTFDVSSKIGVIKSIVINGEEKTFATKAESELGITADFYYTSGETSFESNNSDGIISSGTSIKLTYTPLVQGRQVVYDTTEVTRVENQLNRKGVVARYENRNDVLSSLELYNVGKTYLKYKGSAEITLKVQTQKNIWDIGQVVNFNNAPLKELQTDYMVKKKSTKVIAVGNEQHVFYTYEMTSNFNSETVINYFDNQRNKTTGNISEGEYISRDIDIENTANIIFYGLSIEEVPTTNDNTLNSTLNSPFIS